jgi:hypothetical protein
MKVIYMGGTEDVVYKALADFLSAAPDLDRASRAVEREREIRIGMARTGQGREVVAEFLDAEAAMDEEAVLDLTEGQPTTLVDALSRYLTELEKRDELQPRARVAGELAAILAYPWPEDERRVQLHNPHYGLALHMEEEENRDLVIRMGSNRWEVARVNWEDAGSGGQLACRAVAEAVYRATLARVIADREHIVTLNAAETAQLRRWLNGEPNGSNWIGDRLTVNYDGNGVWIRTRPYSSQHIPR